MCLKFNDRAQLFIFPLMCLFIKGCFKLEWIYEIVSLASHFRSKAALITSNCYSVSSTPFSERAKQMYVSLLGTETLWDEGNLQRALHIITNGNVYSCIEK